MPDSAEFTRTDLAAAVAEMRMDLQVLQMDLSSALAIVKSRRDQTVARKDSECFELAEELRSLIASFNQSSRKDFEL